MNLQKELAVLFQARIPVVNIITYEENWVIREIIEMTKAEAWPQGEGVYSWDIADQFVTHVASHPGFDVAKQATPDTILPIIDQFSGGAVFILKDFHQVWETKKHNIRKLRNLSTRLAASKKRKNIVILTPEPCLPVELKQDVICLDCPKPDTVAMDALLERSIGATRALEGIRRDMRGKIVETALGLSSTQAERVFRKAVVLSRNRRLDESCIDLITLEKRQIIRESGALEFYPHTEAESSVGGLEILKEWLWQRRMAFSEKAREYGLDAPSGLALIGIPGTGKSLCARLTAGLWKLPLLRLDMGAVFGGVLGSSERNIREAIQISEVISPCILWVDEIEKAFAGSAGDSGTASRVLGTFLTWMAEKEHPVFVFATANDVHRLPPEFLRKGRFDEVFFLDLPTFEERKKIMEVHLKKRGLFMLSERFGLEKVVAEAEGFVGAELEAVVKDAMFPAFMDDGREIDTDDLLKSVRDMVPLAKSHATIIENLRKLAKDGLARNASKAMPAEEVRHEAIRGTRVMEI